MRLFSQLINRRTYVLCSRTAARMPTAIEFDLLMLTQEPSVLVNNASQYPYERYGQYVGLLLNDNFIPFHTVRRTKRMTDGETPAEC